jgi:hypothetical protein
MLSTHRKYANDKSHINGCAMVRKSEKWDRFHKRKMADKTGKSIENRFLQQNIFLKKPTIQYLFLFHENS